MTDQLARRLLNAGIIAGPLVVTVGLTLALTREGFDMQRHASSLLALGEHGWMQALNFLVAGGLTAALAVGMRQALRGERGGMLVPWLLGAYALMHILVALFPTDPAFGFPPGPATPVGAPPPADASFHAIVHSLAGFMGFNALAIACFVMAWHFGRQTLFWCLLSVTTGLAILGIDVYALRWEFALTGLDRATAQFNFLPMWALLPLVWGYVSALAWKLRRRLEAES